MPKQKKKLTRKEKRQKFGQPANYLREKAEIHRKKEAMEMDKGFMEGK